MFWHMAAADPMVVTVALALLLARMLELGGDWPIRERVPHLLWVGWVLWFGVIESGITTNTCCCRRSASWPRSGLISWHSVSR